MQFLNFLLLHHHLNNIPQDYIEQVRSFNFLIIHNTQQLFFSLFKQRIHFHNKILNYIKHMNHLNLMITHIMQKLLNNLIELHFLFHNKTLNYIKPLHNLIQKTVYNTQLLFNNLYLHLYHNNNKIQDYIKHKHILDQPIFNIILKHFKCFFKPLSHFLSKMLNYSKQQHIINLKSFCNIKQLFPNLWLNQNPFNSNNLISSMLEKILVQLIFQATLKNRLNFLQIFPIITIQIKKTSTQGFIVKLFQSKFINSLIFFIYSIQLFNYLFFEFPFLQNKGDTILQKNLD